MRIQKYLYLTKYEWTSAWINGGTVPLSLASKYLSSSRSGTQTPDETRIHSSPHDLTKLPLVKIDPDTNIRNITFTGNRLNGVLLPNVINGKYYREDGLILCFCNSRSRAIAKSLGKVACVKINDMLTLKQHIDNQLQVEGIMQPCEYTNDHQRGHFLKSTKDAWQEEYRIFWPYPEPQYVEIPTKTARLAAL